MDDEMIKACLLFAGHIPGEQLTNSVLRRFAGIVRAHTFIECADICDTADVDYQATTPSGAAMWCAKRIRDTANSYATEA